VSRGFTGLKVEEVMFEGERTQEQIAKAISGDRPALQELLLVHTPHLSRHIAIRLPASTRGLLDVEDVLGATFLQAFRNIGTLRRASERSFSAWLTTIAENQLRDILRTLQRQKRGGDYRRLRGPAKSDTSSIADLAEMLSDHGDTPSVLVARQEAGTSPRASRKARTP
jgi:DNA-directed RNA polymerase specialized sigma24 family protein